MVSSEAGGTAGGIAFLRRLATLFALALAAYAIFLLLGFPKYFAPPAALVGDMYQAANFAADGSTFASQLTYPRPIYFEVQLLAGWFGFEGSLVFLDAIVLLDLALLLALVERFIVRRAIPAWMAFGTMMLAMAGPGFYCQPGYDVGYHLALLFGLLGILVWEWHRPLAGPAKASTWTAFAAMLVCFSLSTLSNESFIPALVLYGLVAAYRERRIPGVAVAIFSAPFLAIGASAAWDAATQNGFVQPNAAPGDPYYIDVSLRSLVACAKYYYGSLATPSLLALFAACGIAAFLRGRWRAAAFVTIAGLALSAPYVLLPNHLDQLYQWPAFSLLVLLVPIALVPGGASRNGRAALWAGAAVVALALLAAGEQNARNADDKQYYVAELARSRSEVATVRLFRPQLSTAKSILVCGLPMSESPWLANGDFISHEAGFQGTWTTALEDADDTPEDGEPHVKPIAYAKIRWSDYDFILVFDDDQGNPVGLYRPKDLLGLIAANGWQHLGNRRVIQALIDRASN